MLLQQKQHPCIQQLEKNNLKNKFCKAHFENRSSPTNKNDFLVRKIEIGAMFTLSQSWKG